MGTLSVRLPASLHRKARELAMREGVSVNQLLATALAEKVSALMTVEYLEQRARAGTRQAYDAVLGKIADRAPEPGDDV